MRKKRKKTQQRLKKRAQLSPAKVKRRALRKKEAEVRRQAHYEKLVKGRL
jgi:hypothetical protein